MKFTEIIAKIDKLIKQSPYSREQIATFWQEEADKEWEPEVLLTYGVILDYMTKKGNLKEAENVRQSHLRRLEELKERYAERPNYYHPINHNV